MTDLPDGVTQADIDRYAQLDRGIKALETEKRELGDLIKKAFRQQGLQGRHTLVYPSERYGQVVVTLNEQHRLSATGKAELEKSYPQEQYGDYWVAQLDPKLMPEALVAPYREVVATMSVSVTDGSEAALRSPKRAAVA